MGHVLTVESQALALGRKIRMGGCCRMGPQDPRTPEFMFGSSSRPRNRPLGYTLCPNERRDGMNTFICWSQARSKQMAGVLREWLPYVLPGENFFLSSDIEKGTLWFEAIRTQLQGADAAIICLTPENIDSTWMHFEVGAIAGKNAESRIFTYLFGLTPGEVSGPLAAFQSSSCTKEDTRKLVLALEKICQKPIEKFDEHWPDLETALAAVAPIRVPDLVPGFGDFLNFKTFREPLQVCSDQSWLDRFARLVQVRERMQDKEAVVAAKCSQDDSGLYLQILSELDNYLRLLKNQQSHLIKERKFRRVNGKLDFKDADWVVPEAARICQAIKDRVRALGGHVPESEAAKEAVAN